MAIPEEIKNKLDSDPSWTVQHEDIIQIMDQSRKGKPWSRYMIQQNLDSDPSKATVQARLNELVELDVLIKYQYESLSLYDLAYDPIVTDGGHLRDANWLDVVTLQDRSSVRDLITGAILTASVFFAFGIVSESTGIIKEITIADNFYFNATIGLYTLAVALIILLQVTGKIESYLPEQT